MRKVIILGAGVYQKPLIARAKAMGLYTIVVSIDGDYPGFAIADQVAYIDTTNQEAVLELAQKEKAAGICTTGTDVAMPTLGYVCDQLRLPGISQAAALVFSDKVLMKKKFIETGVPTPPFVLARSLDDGYKVYESLRKPLIFKAVDSSGSRGIVRVDEAGQIKNAYEIVRASTKKDYFLVEEFVEGHEFGAQAFVYKGKVQFVLPHGDFVYFSDAGVPIGHYAPLPDQENIREIISVPLQSLVTASKLDCCALNIDCISHDGQIYILEIGVRAGATCLVELVSLYYGFDYYQYILRASLGEAVAFDPTGFIPNASRLLYSEHAGTIRNFSNNNAENPNIVEVIFDYQAGDLVKKFKTGPDRLGHVITKGPTLEQALSLLEAAIGHIDLQVDFK